MKDVIAWAYYQDVYILYGKMELQSFMCTSSLIKLFRAKRTTGDRAPSLAQYGRANILVETLNNLALHWAYGIERLSMPCGVCDTVEWCVTASSLLSVSTRIFQLPHRAGERVPATCDPIQYI